MSNNPGLQQLSMANKQMGRLEALSSNLGSLRLPIPAKIMGPMEPMSNDTGSQQLLIHNKGVVSTNPGLQHFSAPRKQTVQMESLFGTLGSQQLSGSNKRSLQVESSSNKPGSKQSAVSKKRTAQMEPSPKGQRESFESVRSKLRESLGASLALVSQQCKLETVGKNSQSEAASTLKQPHEVPQLAEPAPANVEVALSQASERLPETLSPNNQEYAQKYMDDQLSSRLTFTSENTQNGIKTWKCDEQDFQLKQILSEEDISFSNSFLMKDELLRGNGLCWESDLDAGSTETMEGDSAKRPKLVNEEVCVHSGELKPLSPEALAFKIEAELFKLFGGVNKKYKEKGRSLLFNLKDRNNPELRERVLSGEISPVRLCSMTAEELASKELSEWRLAKAEELAQMVVLPDSEVDIRRLVRKTHKGEFQVEVEHDDSVSVEVAVGASSLTQIQSKTSERISRLPSEGTGTETPEAADVQYRNNLEDLTTLARDATDPMQGIMMEELKDAEFLPPTVSLDEFMESLHSEPRFENMPGDAARAIPASDEKNASSVDSKLDSSDIGSVDPVDTSAYKLDKTEAKYTRTDGNIKSKNAKSEAKYTRTDSSIKFNNILVDSDTSPSGETSKGEDIWEGLLQLNISIIVTVIGIFKSGEKTSTEEWPSLLEIKGRVRLDAFEKFLQELPMSRSRAIMVVQFRCKEGSPDSRRKILCEVADSYVVDERVGFAEPAPGVELYFCPLNSRTVEILGKYLPKNHSETLNYEENCLIGVVVWRKTLVTSTISPNSSSHHKYNLKKQSSFGRHHLKDANVNATSKPPLPLGPAHSNPEPPPDGLIDDVPPGFGPAAARDEEDLPEFDFVRPLSPSRQLGSTCLSKPVRPPPVCPVDQIRELVHKYGHGLKNASSVNWQHSQGVGLEVQPWNDDDDIPEWQPQLPSQQQPHPPAPLVYGFQQPNPQHLASVSPQQIRHNTSLPFGPQAPQQPFGPQAPQHPMPPLNITQGQGQQIGAPAWQQGSWWAPPTASHGLAVQASLSMQPCHYGGQFNEGQFHGTPGFGAMQHNMNGRQYASRSRGF